MKPESRWIMPLICSTLWEMFRTSRMILMHSAPTKTRTTVTVIAQSAKTT